MGPNRWRMGIRPQLTIIVLLAAVLSTVATLFVTEIAVKTYVEGQARDQEREHMKIASLVLSTNFGQNVSISSDGSMVVDSPGSNGTFHTNDPNAPYGKYALNGDNDYVDLVQQLIAGMVSVYQCTDENGNALLDGSGNAVCKRISTTFTKSTASSSALAPRAVDDMAAKTVSYPLEPAAVTNMGLHYDSATKHWAAGAHEWPDGNAGVLPVVTIQGTSYIADYQPIHNPQGQLIGVLFVGVRYDLVTGVVASTTIELVIIGTIIMVAGVVLAIIVATGIVGTLQRAARQVSGASERFSAIASQQASGSTQQVWAINAINQALQSLSETATDISRRTEQLAQMGNQVLQRRAEISPSQIDSIIAYITRSVRDISVASRQQAATYERMTGAMQAVMEVAEQVAGDSQQTTENAERLEHVVQQLRQLVGVNRRALVPVAAEAEANGAAGMGVGGTVQAIKPGRGGKSDRRLRDARSEAGGAGRGASASEGLMDSAGRRPSDRLGRLGARPASDASMGMGMGMQGGRAGAGMVVAGGAGPRPGQQPSWSMPASGGNGGFGMMPPANFGGGSPFGPPVNSPMAGAAPGSAWGLPAPNSGPNPNRGPGGGPWSMPRPGGAGADAASGQMPNANMGPNSGGGWGVPAPGANQGRFDPGNAPAFGGQGQGQWQTGRGLPPIDGLPEMGEPGADPSFPWTRRE